MHNMFLPLNYGDLRQTESQVLEQEAKDMELRLRSEKNTFAPMQADSTDF